MHPEHCDEMEADQKTGIEWYWTVVGLLIYPDRLEVYWIVQIRGWL